MARGKRHSEEVRASVMAALLAGQGVEEVAKQYKLSKSTVGTWKAQGPTYQEVRTKIEGRAELLDSLLYEYLVQNLKTLRRQSEVFGEADYIRKQPAGEVAVMHGILADKTVRLLEAAELGAGGDDPGGEPA